MKKKTNIWWIAFMTALSIIILAGCTDSKTAEKSKQDKQIKTKDSTKKENDLDTYTSKTSGFTLEYPKTWKNDFEIVEHKSDDIIIEWVTSFHPVVKGKVDKGWAAVSSRIYKLKKETFTEIEKEEGPPLGYKLGENDNYVWLVSLPQENPFHGELAEKHESSSFLRMDFDFFKKHFKVTK